ncbi:MAG: alanine racemase [Lachnospiraceae bacterium]|nr:alanine racemase [Lachnospiraceae bacterium]
MKAEEQKTGGLHFERVCAYIDLDAIQGNLRGIHAQMPDGAKLAAVLKADGYGHGSVAIARELEQEDSVWGYALAVAEEAYQLRAAGIQKPILMLGYTFPSCYEELIRQDIRPAVFSMEMAKDLSEAACRIGKTVRIHIKVDTGMGRIGIFPGEEGISFVDAVSKLDGLKIEGIFTHFAKADEADQTETLRQAARFTEFVSRIEQQLQLTIPIKHCANSAAALELPEFCMDMARVGIIMYGLLPSDEVRADVVKLTPALSWKSHIAFVKELEAGASVSYGGLFTAQRRMPVATIPVGYADGYPRSLTGRGSVLIHGKRCPILGRICMDQFMVDVSEVPDAKVGDEVILLGEDGGERITAEELGALSGRFNYELVCDINKRIPRVYVKNGKPVAYKDDLCGCGIVDI